MSYTVLIAACVLSGLGALASLAAMLTCSLKKNRKGFRVSLAIMVVIILAAGASGAGLVGKGVRKFAAESRKFQERLKRENEERDRERQARIEKLREYADPDIRDGIDKGFFTYEGSPDWRRLPLVYPYQIVWIDDSPKTCRLNKYHGTGKGSDRNGSSGTIVGDITRLAFDRNFALLRREPNRSVGLEVEWLLFTFKTGKTEKFETGKAMRAAARKRGYTGDPNLVKFQSLSYTYFDS